MNLSDVHQGITKNRGRRRVGRGTGSGRGKTSSRGHKGQKSRTGWARHPAFQGGAMPMVRRVPKRGFHNRFAKEVAIVNVGDLESAFQSGDTVNPETLREKSLAKHRYEILKILGNGQLSKKLNVAAHRFSKSAVEQIEKAGGQVIRLPGKTPFKKKQTPKNADIQTT
jgi:large subunit ribosomal protein L15